MFMAFCLGYSALSGALVSFGAPLAAGSGIPEIKTYLNGVHVRGAAHPKTHAPLHGILQEQLPGRLLRRQFGLSCIRHHASLSAKPVVLSIRD